MRTLLPLCLLSVLGCDPGDPGDPDTGALPGEPLDHCGAITADEIWRAENNPHTVSCTVEVLGGATLTIAEGAEVYFGRDDYELRVGIDEPGGLLIEGSAEAPVLLAASGESWYGVVAGPETAPLSLRHVNIEDATTTPGHNSLSTAALYLGAEATLEAVTILRAEECGLMLKGEGRLSADSAGLTVTGGEGWPVCGEMNLLDSLPADSALTGNGDDRIAVDYRETELIHDATWPALVPYLFPTGGVEVCGSVDAPVVWTLSPGIRFEFLEDSHIELGPRAECAGELVAEGSAEAPILFTSGEAAPWAGSWGGVMVAAGSYASFDQVEVGFGGEDYWYWYRTEGALNFAGTGSVANTYIHHAACHAIDLSADAAVTLDAVSYSDNGCEDVNQQ